MKTRSHTVKLEKNCPEVSLNNNTFSADDLFLESDCEPTLPPKLKRKFRPPYVHTPGASKVVDARAIGPTKKTRREASEEGVSPPNLRQNAQPWKSPEYVFIKTTIVDSKTQKPIRKTRRVTTDEAALIASTEGVSENTHQNIKLMRLQSQLDALFDLLFTEMRHDALLGLEISRITIDKAILLIMEYPKNTGQRYSDDGEFSLDEILSVNKQHINFVNQVQFFCNIEELRRLGYPHHPLVKMAFERYGLVNEGRLSFLQQILQAHDPLVTQYGYNPIDVVNLAGSNFPSLDFVSTNHGLLCQLGYARTEIVTMVTMNYAQVASLVNGAKILMKHGVSAVRVGIILDSLFKFGLKNGFILANYAKLLVDNDITLAQLDLTELTEDLEDLAMYHADLARPHEVKEDLKDLVTHDHVVVPSIFQVCRFWSSLEGNGKKSPESGMTEKDEALLWACV